MMEKCGGELLIRGFGVRVPDGPPPVRAGARARTRVRSNLPVSSSPDRVLHVFVWFPDEALLAGSLVVVMEVYYFQGMGRGAILVAAGVAELEFASALGADGRKPVGVRIPPPAPHGSVGDRDMRTAVVVWSMVGPCNWGER